MCGFAGQVIFRGINKGDLRGRLNRALERLQPRGPDKQRCWFDDRCGLANTRLSIQDLSEAGDLPMAEHGLVIAYNGEIYNFKELREELKCLGYIFRSNADTEILLAGWRAWGEELIPKLNGMFAFALWDPLSSELILVRDRLGKKPLLYMLQADGISFASDLIALEKLLDHTPELDDSALKLFFSLRFIPEPICIAQGVKKLMAGHIVRVTSEGSNVRRWYSDSVKEIPIYKNMGEAAYDLVKRFDSAVNCRLVADVPIGIFLSGGIDSALVAASSVRSMSRVKTFTVGFADTAKYYEERPQAALVAKYLDTDHEELEISSGDVRNALDGVFCGLDEPFADSSAIPTFMLSREISGRVKVALTGDGSDEIFGGYRKYQGELLAKRYQTMPLILREKVIEPIVSILPESKSSYLLEHIRRLRRFITHASKDEIGRQVGWMKLLGDNEITELFLNAGHAPDLEKLVRDLRSKCVSKDTLNAMLYADTRLGLPGDMLVKTDRMSMANGLEVRSPFLDYRVVECAEAMPSQFKITLGKGKRILRHAFADRLPEQVFSLPKKGFEIPIADWLVGPLKDLTERSIDPERLRRQGIFRPEVPKTWYESLKKGRRDTSERLWALIAFQAWIENFRPNMAGC